MEATTIQKVERDGKVAVLVSPGFGAGWSTWASDEHREFALFDHRLVEAVEQGRCEDLQEIVERTLGAGAYFYCGGAGQLMVEWVPKGAAFRVDEYDGSESLILASEEKWTVA